MKSTLYLPKYGVLLDDPCCYPLGFMYVSGILKESGDEVKVLNENLWNYDLREEFKRQDVVYFTGGTEFLERNEGARTIAAGKGCKTVIGGAMATFAPELLSSYDSILPGEFEWGTPLDRIPYPDYEGFGIDEYHRRHGYKYMGVLASRGCPFSCSFCAQVCKYRQRDLWYVREEIVHYRSKYGIELVVFNDNTLNVTKSRFLEICDIMGQLKILWTAAIRTDVFDAEMARRAKESGCRFFVVGVESFNPERLRLMNKHITVEDTIRTLNLLHDFDIDYSGNVVLGMDGETMDTIVEEVELMPKCYKIFPVLAQPFPGTTFETSITGVQRDALNELFMKNATDKGKSCYPTL